MATIINEVLNKKYPKKVYKEFSVKTEIKRVEGIIINGSDSFKRQ
jgi:hypothetical protein